MGTKEQFEEVYIALGELSTYGDHASKSPEEMPAVIALKRIEDKYNALHDTLSDVRGLLRA